MKIELRDDIGKQDLALFFGLLVFLAFWVWLIFYSGFVLT
jgi:hypothetical protein